jgi:hypothetical protein
MFQIVDPALVRAMARHDPLDPAAQHGRALAELRRRTRAEVRRARVAWLMAQISSRLRTRSTGVPSFSGTPTSRS